MFFHLQVPCSSSSFHKLGLCEAGATHLTLSSSIRLNYFKSICCQAAWGATRSIRYKIEQAKDKPPMADNACPHDDEGPLVNGACCWVVGCWQWVAFTLNVVIPFATFSE